jgi:transcriptional regulator with XRE-family HTH domain
MNEKLEMNKSTYAMYEIDEREPGFEILIKLSHYFNVSIDYLLKGEDTKMETPKKTFGDRITELRRDQGKTQEDIADSVGVSRSSYSHYENDHVQPEFNTLIEIAKLYNVTSDYLLGMTENKETIENYLNRIRVASGETQKSL